LYYNINGLFRIKNWIIYKLVTENINIGIELTNWEIIVIKMTNKYQGD